MPLISSSNLTLLFSRLAPLSENLSLPNYNFSSILPKNFSISNGTTNSVNSLLINSFDDFFNKNLSFPPPKNNLGLFNFYFDSQITLIPFFWTVFHARDIRSLSEAWLNSHPDHFEIYQRIIQCIETQNVVLDLSGQNLENLDRDLLEIVSYLTWVKTLKLNFNNLRQIPANAFEQMGHLTNLFLNHNSLTTLDQSVFSNLSNLTTLHLHHNQLTELPANLFSDLSSLSTIHLSHNHLTELPPNLFSNLPDLSTIHLSYNQLTELPPNLFNDQTNLFFLFLEANSLTEPPHQIFNQLTSHHGAVHLDANLAPFCQNLPPNINVYFQ